LLANATDGDRIRLWDLYNESKSTSGTIDPLKRRQAADYALSRNPRTVYELVEHYQFYQVEFQGRVDADVTEFRTAVAAACMGPPAQNDHAAHLAVSMARYGQAYNTPGFANARLEKVARDLAGGGDPSTTSAATRAAVGALYERNVAALQGHLGAQRIPPAQEPGGARAAIQRLPEVPFASESAGAYHAHKHSHDLPPAEQTGNEVADYLRALRETIQHPSNQTTTATQLEPGRSHAFTRTVEVRPGGVPQGPASGTP
jgi:hypothetical protein